jgi:hypothetical protein
MQMNTYVIGAGASLHAGYPLARDLGISLLEWVSKEWPSDHDYRNLLEQMADLYGGLGNIEQVLTDLDECLPGSRAATLEGPVRANLRANIRFVMREYFNCIRNTPSPLYERLAREHIGPGDVIITFNYDAACERELKRARLWEISDGYGFSLGIDEIPQSKTKVLKLHGSVNWWGLIFGGSTGFSVVPGWNSLGSRPTLFFRPDFVFLGYPEQTRDPECGFVDKAAGIPAIIMPTLKKHFFEHSSLGHEWDPFWQSLWQQAGCALASAERIAIIGYSMPQADEAARALLLEQSNRNAEITVYSGSASREIQDEFVGRGFPHVRVSGRSRFEDFLSSLPTATSSGRPFSLAPTARR